MKRHNQPLNTELVLQGWQALDPPDDFAERVLAACSRADAKASMNPRRWRLVAGLLAVAGVLVPLCFTHARISAGGAPPAIAHAQVPDFDLGIQRD